MEIKDMLREKDTFHLADLLKKTVRTVNKKMFGNDLSTIFERKKKSAESVDCCKQNTP